MPVRLDLPHDLGALRSDGGVIEHVRLRQHFDKEKPFWQRVFGAAAWQRRRHEPVTDELHADFMAVIAEMLPRALFNHYKQDGERRLTAILPFGLVAGFVERGQIWQHTTAYGSRSAIFSCTAESGQRAAVSDEVHELGGSAHPTWPPRGR